MEALTLANAPDLLNVREAAKLLRVSTATVYDAVKEGKLRGVKLRKRVLVPKTAIVEFMAGTTLQAQTP